MKRLAFLFILTTLLLGSCAPSTASPTQPVAATVPQTAMPSPTLSPTPTAIPSSTPYPPLHTQGPYLLYSRDHKSLTIMDADGSGRKQIQLPNDGYVGYPFEKAVSPDGKWIAYFTGSKDEPYDLALNLFNLENETTLFIANLIAPNFPQNLEPVAQALPSELCSGEGCLYFAKNVFGYGIQAFDWSPDGKHIAFSAQIDGPSSDIYVYSLENNFTRRITKDIQNVLRIEWSPAGDRILYTNSIPGMNYIGKTLHAADFNNPTVQEPTELYGGYFWTGHGWLSDSEYLVFFTGDTGPQQDLTVIDLESQRFKVIWPHTFEYLVVDHQTKNIVLSTIPWSDPTVEPDSGIYLLSANGEYSRIIDDVFVLYPGIQESDFFGITEKETYSINVEGSKELIGPSKWRETVHPVVSPNKKWLILYESENKISLYSDNFDILRSWAFKDYLYNITWRPDSLGIFISGDNFVYYLPVPDGGPIPLDDCSPISHCGSKEFVWLP